MTERANEVQDLPTLIWEGSQTLRINDVRFNVTSDDHELRTFESTKDYFLLGKTKDMVEWIADLGRRHRFAKILDLGIFKGGSVVLYDQLFRPQRLIAVEFWPDPVPALTEYIATNDRATAIRPCYATDQGDRRKLEGILRQEFPDRDLDLVVDDASHLYFQTRESFNAAFPFLKGGGIYVIEDWAWAHWAGDFWQQDNPFYKDHPAMSNLLIELFMLCASRPDLIADIQITFNTITIRRGEGNIGIHPFDIGDHYLLRGRHFEPFL